MKELIGKKVIGFKFKNKDYACEYASSMDKYINKIGEIIHVSDSGEICEVRFEDDDIWSYPTELIQKQLQPEYEVKYIAEQAKEYHTENNLEMVEKPIQYQIGIDAIGVAEKNMTIDECLAIARFNITKYSYRKKNQDLEDFKKVIAYANWAIKLLNKKENE